MSQRIKSILGASLLFLIAAAPALAIYGGYGGWGGWGGWGGRC